MSNNLRRLGNDVAVYGLGRISLQLLAFATLPVLTRAFTKAEYGILETVTTVSAILLIVAPLGLDAGSQRSYFDYSEQDAPARGSVLATAALTILGCSLVLGLALMSFASPLSALLFGSSAYGELFLLAGVLLPLTALFNFALEVLRLQHQPLLYAALALSLGILTATLTIWLVVARDHGIRGVLIAGVVSTGLMLVFALPVLRRSVRGAFSKRELKIMLAYGLPFVPVAAATWVIQLADRFFLLSLASPDDLGIYSLAAKYANLLMLPVAAVGAAWSPFFLSLYNRDPAEERRVRGRTLSALTLVLVWGAVAVSASAYTFFSVVTGPEFTSAYRVVGLLTAGIVAVGMNVVLMSGISIARRTHYFVRYTIYAAAVNTALNFALIPPWSVAGAAVATSATYAVLAWCYAYRAQVLDPAPFAWSRIVRTLALGAVFLPPVNLLHFDSILLEIPTKAAIILLFPFVALSLGALEPESVALLRSRAARLRRGNLVR